MTFETSRLSSSSSEYSVPWPKDESHARHDGSVILKPHTGKTLLRHWIHVAAVVVTAGLTAINLLNVYLMDSDTPNAATILNAFQFAAKLHEILIIGSLMLILMDTVRSRLLTSTGLPFGLLLSPVLFNDLDWLTSRNFWMAMKPSLSSAPLVILVSCSIPFANVAGPLSAITVIPRLGWSAREPAAVNPSFWNVSAAEMWPSRLTASSLPPMCFTGAGENEPCPGNGLKSVDVNFDPGVGGPLRCTTIAKAVSCNSSMGTIGPRDLTVQYDLDTMTAFTSTPPPRIYEQLGSRIIDGFAGPIDIPNARVIDAKKIQLLDVHFLGNQRMMKPATKVECRDLTYAEIYETLQTSAVLTNWSTPFVHWLNDVDDSQRPNFLFTYLRNDSSLDARTECSGQECFGATGCSISAKWVPVEIWANTAQSSLLFHSNPQPRTIFEAPTDSSTTSIFLEKAWLETFTLPTSLNISKSIPNRLNDWRTPMVSRPSTETPTATSQQFFNPGNYSQAIAVMLASVITEAMGAASDTVGESVYTGNCSNTKPDFRFSPQICEKQVTDWVNAKDLGDVASDFFMAGFTVRREGYGWFLGSSITVKLALGILLLHAFLTLVHLVYVLLFRRSITTRWASAPEMLMLALMSLRSPMFVGSSVKTRDPVLWREPVSVMEVDGGERVSLIVGDPYSYPERLGGPPVLGKKYQ